LAINGLRVSEALGADIEALGLERGHRTLTVSRKGGKIVTIPLASRTARAIDLAIGERLVGPIFLNSHGLAQVARATASAAAMSDPHLLDLCRGEGIDAIPLPDSSGKRWLR